MKSISKMWGDKIISGEKTYADVPTQLKDEVAEYLKEQGHGELVKKTTTRK